MPQAQPRINTGEVPLNVSILAYTRMREPYSNSVLFRLLHRSSPFNSGKHLRGLSLLAPRNGETLSSKGVLDTKKLNSTQKSMQHYCPYPLGNKCIYSKYPISRLGNIYVGYPNVVDLLKILFRLYVCCILIQIGKYGNKKCLVIQWDFPYSCAGISVYSLVQLITYKI